MTSQPAPPPQRVACIDAFRGLVMTLMLAEALHLSGLVKFYADSALAQFIAFHTSHVEWAGCSLHDLIQPGFSFLVGAALPFSIAARRARGQAFPKMLAHALWRGFVLIFLGIFLRSMNRPITNFTFEDTLTQIGLGYPFLFLLGWTRPRRQVIACLFILTAYWLAFVLYPAPGPGLFAHFEKNTNVAWAFDVWFLNLFPRQAPFTANGGGYSTLSFIPTLATMIIGLLAGGFLRLPKTNPAKLRGLAVSGLALALFALLLQAAGICPIVKRIWTPAWTLYSGGLVLLMLAALFAITEIKGWRAWAFPLLIVGSNSIAAYLMSWTMEDFFAKALLRHLGPAPFAILGPAFEKTLLGAGVLLIFWLILLWMNRRKIFLRI
jgi:predicted acyltransferase